MSTEAPTYQRHPAKRRPTPEAQPRALPLINRQLFCLLAASLLLPVGCGYEETYTGMGDQALPGSPLRPLTEDDDPCQCNCQCTGGGEGEGEGEGEGRLDVEDLGGYAYRFDSFELTEPLPEEMAGLLNGYFADEIAKGAAGGFNVLLVIDEDEREAGTLTGRVGAGEAAEGSEAFELADSASQLGLTLSGARFQTAEPATLQFPNAMLVPPALPIQALKLSGLLSADGSTIAEGVLEGALTAEDAGAVKLGATTFAALLEGLEVAKDLDMDDDGVFDAWRFGGSFTAARAELAQ